jgi:hypothetical protein
MDKIFSLDINIFLAINKEKYEKICRLTMFKENGVTEKVLVCHSERSPNASYWDEAEESTRRF